MTDEAEPDSGHSVVFRLQLHARQQPTAEAVIADDRILTYSELERQSARIARALKLAGAKPADIIAVSHERTANLVSALLGVLTAGCAYCPIDPRLPSARVEQMIARSGARIVLVSASSRTVIPTSVDSYILCVDDLLTSSTVGKAVIADASPLPEHPAYLLFTSGSTGIPKGVLVEHSSLSNFLSWAETHFGKQRLGRVLATSALSFDSSVFEIFAPLFCGGTLLLLESPLRICSVATARPRLLSCAPSVAASLLRAGWIPDSIETVVLAGEPVPDRLAADIQDRLPGVTLYNCYGLTEATVYSTAAVLRGSGWQHAPIGQPIANTSIYLLDEALNQVPIGVPGEIFIGGKGVARMYIGEPQLTAERFIDNPFGEGRLLRTGDWGRYDDDGCLVLLGRLDHQIKIRGLRVDLGDVESHLRTCSGIDQCAVTVLEEPQGGPQLVAYYTASGLGPSESEIRAHLGKRIPAYMVPSHFKRLEELPLNESGKLARALLQKHLNAH